MGQDMSSSLKISSILTALCYLSLVNSFFLCEDTCICDNETVSCEHVGLDTLPHDLPDSNIKRLLLKGNNIQYVSETLMFYQSLRDLDLSFNSIVEIFEDSFEDSGKLTTLDLSHNKLGSLKEDDLSGLRNLSFLNLTHNEIDYIARNALSHCPLLKILDLSYNKIGQLDSNFLGESITRITELQELYLVNNNLRTVPKDALKDLKHLTVLDLSENQFATLDGNDFDEISESLLELRLSGCGIHTISSQAFYGLSTLKSLDLSDNGLYHPPNSAFQRIPLLETLKIGQNNIQYLKKQDYLFLRKLKNFNFDGCNSASGSFKVEEGIFSLNTNLESIEIKCSLLINIPESVNLKHLPDLKHLSFHGSGLNSIPHDLAHYHDLQTLDLESNPLNCNCSLVLLYRLLTLPNPVQVTGTCAQPDTLQDAPLTFLSEEDYNCKKTEDGDPATWLYISGLAGGSIISIVVVVLLVCFCWKRKPWSSCFRQPTPRKKLSRRFSGDKRDIVVMQRDDVFVDDGKFLPLKGLNYADPEYVNLDLNSNKSPQSEHLYSELAEVTETVPNYKIPIPNVNCPDVKISSI